MRQLLHMRRIMRLASDGIIVNWLLRCLASMGLESCSCHPKLSSVFVGSLTSDSS